VQATVAEMSGDIQGEATEALAALEQARNGSQRLVVSCANLIRVDFSAAGSILNWVAQSQAEGCQIQFRDMHRLVAAFFGVIGINEHARILMRSN
jgi:anti-anti-sigma regulatory factor